VNAAVRKIAASCSDAAAPTSAQTSSVLKTSMSPLLRTRWRSTPLTGFTGSPQTFTARRNTPCRSTSSRLRVVFESALPLRPSMSPARHASTSAAVIVSSLRSPNSGTR
jgi:hypothetical protein